MNDFSTPKFNTAKSASTQVAPLNLPEEKQKKKQGLTPQEAYLKAVNEGKVDIGPTSGQGLTPQEAINRSRVKEAAKVIPNLIEKHKAQYIQDLKDKKPWTDRVISGANSFYNGLLEFVPKALETKAILQTGVMNLLRDPNNQLDPTYTLDYHRGKKIGKALEDIFPENPLYRNEFWAGTVAKMSGNITANTVVALASGGSSELAVAGSTLLNATLSSDYYKEAKKNGASNQTAFENTVLNMSGVSAIYALPMGRYVSRINKVTGGGFNNLLKAGFNGSIEQGAAQAIAKVYENTTAKAMYDKSRDIMDGVVQAGVSGALIGFTLNSVTHEIVKRGAQAKNARDLMAAKESLEYLQKEFGDIENLYKDAGPGRTNGKDAQAFLELIGHTDKKGNKVTITKSVEGPNGVASPDIKNTKEKASLFKNLWVKYLRTGGAAGKGVAVRREQMHAAIDSHVEEMHFNLTRLEKSILNEYSSKAKSLSEAINSKNDPVPSDVLLKVGKELAGEKTNLSKEVKGAVKRMNEHISQFSAEIIGRGYAQGKLKASIMENFGVYVHRSYRAYDQNVTWNKEVIPDDIWNKAVAHMRNRRLSQLRESGVRVSESALMRQAEDDVQKMLHSKDIGSVYELFTNKKITVDKGNRDIFKSRQEIPQVIKDVLGEYKNGAVNYINTINKMANTIEKRKFFDDLAKQFEGKLFFKDSASMPFKYDEAKTNLPTGVGSKLEDMYMHKDMYDALVTKQKGEQAGWLTMLYRANAAAKYSKTVLSHVAHIRNLFGGTAFLTFNGHMFNRAERTPAWRKAASAFKSYQTLDEAGLRNQWLEYVNLGLHEGSVRAGELKDIFKDMKFDVNSPEQFMTENFNHLDAKRKGRSAYEKGKGLFKKYSKKATNLYRAEDSFLRIWMYELEKARLQEADPNISNRAVADVVNDLYPNYNRINKALKGFRKVPFISPFVSFPAEVVRTSFNTGKRAMFELSSDNPKLNKIGRQRMAGMFTTILGFVSAGAASQALIGMSDDQEQATRKFLPPWSQNSVVSYLPAPEGKVRYINTSYTNPYAFILDPLVALLQGDSDRTVLQRSQDSLGELFAPLLQEELFFKSLEEVKTNKTDNGAEVYNPEDKLSDKIQKSFLHMWSAVEPGSFSSAERFFEPLLNKNSHRNSADELAGLFGLRISTVDIKRSYGFRLRDYRKRIRNARRVYNSVKYRKGASPESKQEALQRSNEQYRSIFRELNQITDAAQESGVRWNELKNIMKDSGLANRDINALRNNDFQPFKP